MWIYVWGYKLTAELDERSQRARGVKYKAGHVMTRLQRLDPELRTEWKWIKVSKRKEEKKKKKGGCFSAGKKPKLHVSLLKHKGGNSIMCQCKTSPHHSWSPYTCHNMSLRFCLTPALLYKSWVWSWARESARQHCSDDGEWGQTVLDEWWLFLWPRKHKYGQGGTEGHI